MANTREKEVGKLKFNRENVIGHSSGTVVFKGKYEEDIDVAIKRIQISDASVEINVFKKNHSHRNIVKYYVTEFDEDFNYIGTELCRDTLENLVNKKYEGQEVGSKLEILKQITQGLEYLHSNDVVHRDIKPQNILISFPHGSVPPLMKLTDFGISRIHKEGRSDLTKTGSSGTLGWIAPEFYDPTVEKYTRLADIFPLGCVFCYVLSGGKHPFGDEKDLRQGNIKSGRYDLPMEDLEKYDHAFELIEAMLDPNPEKRPTASQVLAHPFFQSLRSDESTAAIASLTTSGKIKEISQLFEKQLKAKAVLGKGSFNTIVCKAPYNESMRAIKRIEKVFNDSYINEIELLSSDELNNTHVVRYFNHEDDELYWYIIMELCDFSLTQCIDNIDKKINFEFSKPDSGLLQQIVFGLNFLHGIGIVHRDIKPSNVLVKFQPQSNSPTKTPNNKPLLKLADFGISKKLDAVEKDVTTKRRGSTGWMAPELFATPAEYTKAVDVFAAGLVLFYASTTGSHPFAPDDSATTDIGSNLNFEACQDSIKKEKTPKKLIMLNGSPGICNLIDWMIQPKFKDRPVIEKVLEHPYFWNADQALNFVRQVSEKIEGIKCPSEEHSTFIQPLENLKDQLFSSNWEDELTPKVKENLNFRRKNYPYDGTSVAYLIRAIRNKHAHYETLKKEEKDEFGILPDGYLKYWLSRFPKLLVLTWRVWDGSELSKEPASEENLSQMVVVKPLEKALPISDCAWNPVNRNLMASVSLDAITSVWDTSENPPKNQTFQFDDCSTIKKPFLTMAWNKSGEILAAGNCAGDVIFWDVDGTQLQHLPNVMGNHTRRLEFHPSEDFMLGISSNQLMVIWTNPLEPNRSTKWTQHEFDTIYYANFNEGKPLVAVCGSLDSKFAVQIIEIRQDETLHLCYQIDSAHNEKINECKWSIGEETLLATCSDDHAVKVWSEKHLHQELLLHKSPVTTIEWNPLQLILASASVDGTINIWNASEGALLYNLDKVHQRTIKTLAFSPDGEMLASGGYDNLINVWKFEVTEKENIQTILSEDIKYRINKLVWNSDSSKLGAALNNGTVGFFEKSIRKKQ